MRPKNEMTNTGMKLRQLSCTATQQPTMAATALTPPFLKFPSSSLSPPKSTKPRTRTRTRTRVSLHTSSIPHASFSDPFVLQLAETLEDSLPPSSSPPLQKLRDASSEALLSTPWPSRKDEPFRFTDTSLIKTSRILPVPKPTDSTVLEGFFGDTQFPNLVIVDGHVVGSSNLSELPDGVYVGSLLNISSEDILKMVSEIVSGSDSGDLFWSINGLGAPDLTVVYVPAGCRVEDPIHLRYLSVEGSDVGSAVLPVSNPKVLMLVEEGGEIGVIEEYVCGDGDGDGNKCYWTNSVMEVVIGKGGKVKHSYIQNQSTGAVHIKWTSIHQETESGYELIEVSSGGKLSRHNVHVQQLGSDTSTELSTFHLSITDQTQDLHSSLVLDHPRGYTQQLHKCIVAHSQGQAVFDGNVKVNRNAQQTDAGQLTRSLLLVPRATVNVKPNLQIIADDVKCSHGAAISDLEESQLFYFQARGIDLETARRALVFSFGAEVIERLPYPSIREKVENHIKQLLDPSLKGSSSQGA